MDEEEYYQELLGNNQQETQEPQAVQQPPQETTEEPQQTQQAEVPAPQPQAQPEERQEEPAQPPVQPEEKPQPNVEEDEFKGVPKGVLKRFGKLTERNRRLEEENREFRTRLEAVERKNGIGTDPTKADFLASGKTEEDYIDFRARKMASQMLQESKTNDEYVSASDDFHRRLDSFREANPELALYEDEVYKLPTNRECNMLLYRSPVGPQMMLALGKMKHLRDGYSAAQDKVAYLKALEVHTQNLMESIKNPRQNQPPQAQPPAQAIPPQQAQPKAPQNSSTETPPQQAKQPAVTREPATPQSAPGAGKGKIDWSRVSVEELLD